MIRIVLAATLAASLVLGTRALAASQSALVSPACAVWQHATTPTTDVLTCTSWHHPTTPLACAAWTKTGDQIVMDPAGFISRETRTLTCTAWHGGAGTAPTDETQLFAQ